MNWKPLPFIRLLMPFTIGILAGFYYAQAQLFHFSWMFSLFSGLALVGLAYRQPLHLVWERRYGALMTLFWLAFGYAWTYRHDERRDPQHFAQAAAIEYIAVVAQPPQQYSSSERAPLRIEAYSDSAGVWHRCAGQLLATFALDSTTVPLAYGDRLLLRARPQPIESAKNPYSFDPQWFYGLQNIHYNTYISANDRQRLESGQGSWLWTLVYDWRAVLLDLLQQHLGDGDEYGVGAALLFGVRDDLSYDLKNAYSDTGATHILAVSGMHVGILAYIWGWLLAWWKPRRQWIRAIKTTLLLGVIWLFVFLAGASPSVLRAGVMFSFICGAQLLDRRANIYNTLASSAFVLLLQHPYTLFDVGFQLSYLAVLGIVLLERPIHRLWYAPNALLRAAWKMTAVSLAAQLVTTPISLYYFHQFPVSFWLSGLIAIPLSSAALPIGMALLVFHWIPPLADLLGWLLWANIWLMNAFIYFVQQLPYSVIEGIWIVKWEMLCWYGVLFSFFIAIKYQRKIGLKIGLLLLITLAGGRWKRLIDIQRQSQVWLYHVPKGTMLAAISGNRAVVFADSAHQDSRSFDFTLRNHFFALGVQQYSVYGFNETIKNEIAYSDGTFLQLNQLRLALPSFQQRMQNKGDTLALDYVLLQQNPRLKKIERLDALYRYRVLAADASNKRWRDERWAQRADSLGVAYRSVWKEGAVRLDVGD